MTKGKDLKLLEELQKRILPRLSFHLRMTTNYEGDTMRKLTLFIVSDSVGETAELVAKAAASQFRQGLEAVVDEKIFTCRR